MEPGITGSTKYYYNPQGSMVRKEMDNGLETVYEYNNLGQLVEETKPGNETTTFTYDAVGNLKTSINPLGVKVVNRYNSNNQVESLEYFGLDESSNYAAIPDEVISYSYDRVGNRLSVVKEKNTEDIASGETKNIRESSITYSYDVLNRITDESRRIEDKQYTTSYQYDRYGNLTGIKYPGGSGYLEYNYDDLNQLRSISDSW